MSSWILRRCFDSLTQTMTSELNHNKVFSKRPFSCSSGHSRLNSFVQNDIHMSNFRWPFTVDCVLNRATKFVDVTEPSHRCCESSVISEGDQSTHYSALLKQRYAALSTLPYSTSTGATTETQDDRFVYPRFLPVFSEQFFLCATSNAVTLFQTTTLEGTRLWSCIFFLCTLLWNIIFQIAFWYGLLLSQSEAENLNRTTY